MSYQPPIKAVPLELYPTMETLQGVIDYADTKLPIHSRNDLCSLLFIYQNTLLKLLKEQQ